MSLNRDAQLAVLKESVVRADLLADTQFKTIAALERSVEQYKEMIALLHKEIKRLEDIRP